MKPKIVSPYYDIICNDITLFYGSRKIFSLPEFHIDAHEKILLQWPSGSGKSSFLSLLAGLIYPSGWSLKYNSKGSVVTPSSSDFLNFRRKNISITFSDPLFFDDLNVEENILFPHIFAGLAYDRNWKEYLIEELEVGHILRSSIIKLSSGEKDRINLIRALLYKQPVLLLDEPWSHMDSVLFQKFLTLLSSYLEEIKPTLILVSHSERYIPLVDRVYICEKWVFSHR